MRCLRRRAAKGLLVHAPRGRECGNAFEDGASAPPVLDEEDDGDVENCETNNAVSNSLPPETLLGRGIDASLLLPGRIAISAWIAADHAFYAIIGENHVAMASRVREVCVPAFEYSALGFFAFAPIGLGIGF